MTDFVTRDEHQAAIDRLDAADAELRVAHSSLERELRRDYEEKISDAVDSVKETFTERANDLKEDIGHVQDHLTWQDRTVAAAVILMLVAVAAHYLFGVSLP